MKQALLTLTLLTFLPLQGFSQDWMDEDEENKVPKLLKSGDFMFTAYGSYPNFPRYFAQLTLDNNLSFVSGTTSGVAPIGLLAEYMLSDRIGFTAEGIYNSWGVEWRELGLNDTISSSFSVKRYRFLVGFNYHFDEINNEKVDIFTGFALGPNLVKVENNFENDFGFSSLIEFPISFRTRIGLRYFFNDNFAGVFELGIGGAGIRFGLTYRLPKDNPRAQEKSRM